MSFLKNISKLWKKETPQRSPKTWDETGSMRKKAKRYAMRLTPENAPSWKELERKGDMVAKDEPLLEPIAEYKTLKFAGLLVALVVLGTLYVRHVNATEKIYNTYRAASKDNTDLRLEKDRLAAEYDRITNPRVVLRKAAALGLKEGYKFEKTITIE